MILIGSVFAVFLFKSSSSFKGWGQNYYAGLFLLLLAIIIRARSFIFYQKYVSEYLFALMIGFVITTILNKRNLLAAILNSEILVRIGVLSYSLYIWQQLFVGPNAWQPWMSSLRNAPLWEMIIIKIVAVFIVALISYAFEKLFLKQKDRLRYARLTAS
jgi:peptidoglycan/LPS O-acetylase OafA/YrhL